jgi:ABC-type transporter Mla subunit MlaD
MNESQTKIENSERRLERWVGVFVVAAVLLLLAGFAYYLYRTAERKGWRVPRVPYYTFVTTADGLEVGDPVQLMGFDIGEITVIDAQPPGSYYNVFVGLEIKRPYYGYIWSDSKIKVASSGFLGKRQLVIVKGYDGQPTVEEQNRRPHKILIKKTLVLLAQNPKGAFLPPDEAPSITERAEKLVGQVEVALPGILALTNRINAVLDNAAHATTQIAQLSSNANLLAVSARPVMTNMNVITANLRNPQGALGEWLIPTNLNARLDATLDSANFNLNLLAGNLNKTLENLAAMTGSLSTQVQTNDQILAQISKLVVDTDNLVQGLKKHWLLRGVFQQKAVRQKPVSVTPLTSGTNATPSVNFRPVRPANEP